MFQRKTGFDEKASFASRPLSRLIRWYNKSSDKTKEVWEKAIQFHRTFHGLKITNWRNFQEMLSVVSEVTNHKKHLFKNFTKNQKQPPEVFCENRCFKSFTNFTEKRLCWRLFLIKLQTLSLQLYKKTPPLVFSYEICEMFRSTYFEEYLQTTSPEETPLLEATEIWNWFTVRSSL